ncbi:hypothetical protein K3759_13195 [Sulfitobacter sp. W027]|jgi:hypothetical protein|uniref:hypothetical protein n=1 Tax=Sulfitobacter sp. W027 TaxID=2867025 RepID=UPI0021A7F0FE|nr:hypothetical protein [Sulfitobacter sp. W027]UWR32898.1 hypothetical protein K3759_13195 [Sulfitobacter sp. W027]
MLKSISVLVVLGGVLVACGSSGGLNGIAQLGSDFVRAFNQDRNDEPISLAGVTLPQLPTREPFNP